MKFIADVYPRHKPKLMPLEQCVLVPIHVMKFVSDLNGNSAELSATTDYACQYWAAFELCCIMHKNKVSWSCETQDNIITWTARETKQNTPHTNGPSQSCLIISGPLFTKLGIT